MEDFKLSDVLQVKNTYSTETVNALLQKGWKLLGVFQESAGVNDCCPMFVLGTTEPPAKEEKYVDGQCPY